MPISNNIRVVVGIDFGTTYSGFSFAHLSNSIIASNDKWPEQVPNTTKNDKIEYWDQIENLKTNTILGYDANFESVKCWGPSALVNTTERKDINPVELFKLHLSDLDNLDKDKKSNKPYLPSKLVYKKAITDYLREMGKQLVKKTVTTRWPGIEWHQVLLVLAVPAEFPEKSKSILRKCAYDANLISNLRTYKLQFTTEPEAAAIYCIDNISETEIYDYIGRSFLVVDCGGGTVDLTIRKLLSKDELGEVTIRTGGLCGSTYIDQEFIKFLERKLGKSAINSLKEHHYGQYRLLIHEFCKNAKLPFTGVEEEYKAYELDIKKISPKLKQYVTKQHSNENRWTIKLAFNDVKKMFNPVINQIIKLIRDQLEKDDTCSIMFLVGEFGESKYLQKRIQEEFKEQQISVPPRPIAAVARGAVSYGINEKFIKNRVLKYNYGRSTLRPYDENIDPIDRRRESGHVLVFKLLAKKGTVVDVDQKFSQTSHPENSDQEKMWYQILITERDDVRYPDEDGVIKLGDFIIDLPDAHLGKDRKVQFELCFGKMEIQAYAKNEHNGQEYEATFDYYDKDIAEISEILDEF
ncbi:uncharacterized protein OCT59_029993 [Rhizophagus irregularis]|uniref:Actin-like ATPase domain-containing protein n=2 Tax=Rhizophagus irregularis TaxID=588596 RepID=A0A015JL92_RHIIW|nr:hypothetical protein GLOIN_2v1762619 [Rhizophagus irregularis DAOM 181602=DAOM 197198]EXX67980.1 hypothetical protein RirG_109240 [Rhizophagus irregularis DAOM 197198w]POG82041.1 hypothetical protein GLOIN_2v1762619 [Rhizophagus irregularis DAOM 181602=DAOM 197198]UZO09780.1 hypothetical protein OCT59_029993 [Rhizophagus irregularis]|eukprot:XP_025188907.1 hypothetical protein GLOIN_2v1762619 [Rhizophagus irregularis DAOM 181602=DAOM 197198]